jgi:hypothetical protein
MPEPAGICASANARTRMRTHARTRTHNALQFVVSHSLLLELSEKSERGNCLRVIPA